MNAKELEELNLDRASAQVKTLNRYNAFPVVICALTFDKRLIVFGFNDQDKKQLKVMLKDFLDSLDNAVYPMPLSPGGTG